MWLNTYTLTGFECLQKLIFCGLFLCLVSFTFCLYFLAHNHCTLVDNEIMVSVKSN